MFSKVLTTIGFCYIRGPLKNGPGKDKNAYPPLYECLIVNVLLLLFYIPILYLSYMFKHRAKKVQAQPDENP